MENRSTFYLAMYVMKSNITPLTGPFVTPFCEGNFVYHGLDEGISGASEFVLLQHLYSTHSTIPIYDFPTRKNNHLSHDCDE